MPLLPQPGCASPTEGSDQQGQVQPGPPFKSAESSALSRPLGEWAECHGGRQALPVTAALCQEVWGGPYSWVSPLILVRGALRLLLAFTGSMVCRTDALASWEAPQQQQGLNKRTERETFPVGNAGACSPSALPGSTEGSSPFQSFPSCDRQ